jgi:MFS family permease
MGLAQPLVVLDAPVLDVALLFAKRALQFPNDDRQWLMTACTLAFGALRLLGGRLDGLSGRKSRFLGGLVERSIPAGSAALALGAR